MTTLPLSVIMLVHRNDNNLRKALASVSFASEIVIIDHNSKVNWNEFETLPLVVKSMTEPMTDFSAVRNDALKIAKNDWVFFLDSDEEVVQPAIPKFAAILATTNVDGAVVYRSDIFHGKKMNYGEAGHQPLVRLGKKNALHFTGAVHETADVVRNVEYSRIELLHHAHPSINEFIVDVAEYAAIVAQHKKTSFLQNLLEMVLYPPAKLLYGLIIQGGMMDGWQGITYATCMSLHSLLVRIYRYEIITNAQHHT